MRKNIYRAISGILTVTMLCFSVDFSVLAAEPEVAVTDEEEDFVIEEISSESDLNADDFEEEISEGESNTETSDEEATEGLDKEVDVESSETENIITEEYADLEDEALFDEETDSKKAQKELSRAELYEKARKKEGVTLDKSADEIGNPYENPTGVFEGPERCIYDAIYFGTYIQTDTDKDGKFDDEQKEPIKWRVLSIDDENRVLLLADKVLDQYVYLPSYAQDISDDIFWHNSSIRSWLNGYGSEENYDEIDFSNGKSFAFEAFNEKERASLIQNNLTNNFIDLVNPDTNYDDYNTYDKIFLLSKEEMENSDYGYIDTSGWSGRLNYHLCRSAEKTDYASQSKYVINGKTEETLLDIYFLRTVENKSSFYETTSPKSNFAYSVGCSDGSLMKNIRFEREEDYENGRNPSYKLGGVRPAIYIDLDEADWAYAGQIASDGMPYGEVEVHFDANGGTTEYETVLYSIFTSEYDLETPIPVREGYCFSGWDRYTANGKRYIANSDKHFEMEEGVYFVASWSRDWASSYDEQKSIYLDPNIKGFEGSLRYENCRLSESFRFLLEFKSYYSKYADLQPYFLGWYTEPVGGRKVLPTDRAADVPERIYAHWDTSEIDERDKDSENFKYDEFWTSEVGNVEYTGGNVKPEIRVYYGFKRLVEGKDYTLTYANNQNICESTAANAPTITITGKKNYSETETVKFSIVPKDLSDDNYDTSEGVTIPPIALEATGEEQKPLPVVKINGKTLKKDTDYTVRYLKKIIPEQTTEGAPPEPEYINLESVKEEGTYILEVTGCGNYCGTVRKDIAVSAGKDISTLKMSKVKDRTYNLEGTHEVKPEFKLTDGKYTLLEGIDYTCTYKANTKVGTASITVTGTDNSTNEKRYYGSRIMTFKITAMDIKGAEVSGIPENVTYTGYAQTLDTIKVVKNGTELREGEDYEISYEKNINSGKANVIIKGKGNFKGSIKKTFKINPLSLPENSEGEDSVIKISTEENVPYTTGGTEPEVSVKHYFSGNKEVVLIKGRDYTVKCSNNKKVNDGTGLKIPTVKITGKGNFTGSITKTYTISRADISDCKGGIPDKVYQSKAGKWKSKIVVLDTNGKKLKAGRDFVKSNKYVYDNVTVVKNGKIEIRRYPGETVNKKDILPAGTTIRIDLKGKGNYDGEISVKYHIVKKQISKLKIEVEDFEYTGKEIVPTSSTITVMDGVESLSYWTNVSSSGQYEIIGHKNNINVGTAEVTLKGRGNYTGTVKVKYKITPKKIKWWWNKEE